MHDFVLGMSHLAVMPQYNYSFISFRKEKVLECECGWHERYSCDCCRNQNTFKLLCMFVQEEKSQSLHFRRYIWLPSEKFVLPASPQALSLYESIDKNPAAGVVFVFSKKIPNMKTNTYFERKVKVLLNFIDRITFSWNSQAHGFNRCVVARR